MTPEQKPKTAMSAKKAAGILIVLIVIVAGIAYGTWWFFEQFAIQNRALDAGCTIEAFNQYGLATSYMCPEGYELK